MRLMLKKVLSSFQSLINFSSIVVAPMFQTELGSFRKSCSSCSRQARIEFMVEGHTDDVPIQNEVLLDNWDLSVKEQRQSLGYYK